jgi:enterochelin esterase family protein
LAIQELEHRGHAHPLEIEAFLRSHEFPLVEGPTVTFVYLGAADEVHLRHWIHGLPSTQPFRRLHGGPLWFLVMDLPEGSRVEYKLELVRGGHRELVRDPLNPHLAHDPFGANSVVHAAGYVEPEWARADSEARPGAIIEHALHSAALGGERSVLVYEPARFRSTRRYPLLVVHDGEDYLRFADLKTVLDNLIHRLEIPPLIAALTQSDERHGRFLVEELLPSLAERFPLVDEPSARGLMGASFGAVAALSTAWRAPGAFGNLLLQSGSFAFTDIGRHEQGPAWDGVVDFVNAFRRAPGRPAERVYVSCGIYEGLIYYNRSLVPLLQSTGMAVRYTEARDGHNWENWRDRLREGLSWLFPGPLWLVYE